MSDRGSFAADIESAAAGEPIEGVVVGSSWSYEERVPAIARNVLLSWAEARPALDFAYDNGFGGAECPPVWAWTPRRVLVVSEYDGATGVEAVPRFPLAGKPEYL